MKSGKSVGNGTNGGRVSDIMIKSRSHASKGVVGGKAGGSLGLAPNVVGETHEPFQLARGFSPSPNPEPKEARTPESGGQNQEASKAYAGI